MLGFYVEAHRIESSRVAILLSHMRGIYENILPWRKKLCRHFDEFALFQSPEYGELVSGMPSLCLYAFIFPLLAKNSWMNFIPIRYFRFYTSYVAV